MQHAALKSLISTSSSTSESTTGIVVQCPMPCAVPILWDYSPKRGFNPSAGRNESGQPLGSASAQGRRHKRSFGSIPSTSSHLERAIRATGDHVSHSHSITFILYLHREHTSGLLRKGGTSGHKLGTEGHRPHTPKWISISKEGASSPTRRHLYDWKTPGTKGEAT